MMWSEFEELAGYRVTRETYETVIEPMYMATNLSKRDFVKLINRKAVEYKPVRQPNVKRMRVRDHSGRMMTPNGCWYHIQYVDLIDVDIKTGKRVIALLDEETEREYLRRTDGLETGFDFDYTEAVDAKRKPIELTWSW